MTNDALKAKLKERMMALELPLVFAWDHDTIFFLLYTNDEKEEKDKLDKLLAMSDEELKEEVAELIRQYYDAIEE